VVFPNSPLAAGKQQLLGGTRLEGKSSGGTIWRDVWRDVAQNHQKKFLPVFEEVAIEITLVLLSNVIYRNEERIHSKG
jgi:hypothetical protein